MYAEKSKHGLNPLFLLQYYIDPVSGCRFRSKKEVLYFLETGTRRKKKQTENSDAETKVSQNLCFIKLKLLGIFYLS